MFLNIVATTLTAFLMLNASFPTTDARKSSTLPLRRVCLVSPALPWTFGPYQAQMYELSLLLADRGYEIYFMIHVVANSFPPGMYRSYAEIAPMTASMVRVFS